MTDPNLSPKPVCRTAKPATGADTSKNAAAEACMPLTPGTMRASDPTKWLAVPAAPVTLPFTPQSFGEVPQHPHILVELTNPIDWEMPAGYGGGAPTQIPPRFTAVRTTVFVEMRPDITKPADNVSVGRGRLIVGPY